MKTTAQLENELDLEFRRTQMIVIANRDLMRRNATLVKLLERIAPTSPVWRVEIGRILKA